MRSSFLILLLTLTCSVSSATIRIAMIDTGISDTSGIKMCDNGMLDFTGEGIKFNHPHGNNISHVIADKLENVDYCLYSLKVFTSHVHGDTRNIVKALRYINKNLKIDILNVSAGGSTPDKAEKYYINALLAKGVLIIAAAGNDNQDLDKHCRFYPACYGDDIISVGCVDKEGNKCPLSNTGKYIKVWEPGFEVNAGGYVMTGTSQATALTTHRMILFINHLRKKDK